MSAAEWTDIYSIHHWRSLWSSYRKLVWVGFVHTIIKFRWNAQTDWAIRPYVQLTLRANFVQLLHFHHLFSLRFHFGCCVRQSPGLFQWKFFSGNHMNAAERTSVYSIQHWRSLWSSYKKLAWVRFEPTITEFGSDASVDWGIRPWVQLAPRVNFVQLLQFHRLLSIRFHLGCRFRQLPF